MQHNTMVFLRVYHLPFRLHVVSLRYSWPGLGRACRIREDPVHELRRLQAQVRYQSLHSKIRRESAQVCTKEMRIYGFKFIWRRICYTKDLIVRCKFWYYHIFFTFVNFIGIDKFLLTHCTIILVFGTPRLHP